MWQNSLFVRPNKRKVFLSLFSRHLLSSLLQTSLFSGVIPQVCSLSSPADKRSHFMPLNQGAQTTAGRTKTPSCHTDKLRVWRLAALTALFHKALARVSVITINIYCVWETCAHIYQGRGDNRKPLGVRVERKWSNNRVCLKVKGPVWNIRGNLLVWNGLENSYVCF